MVRFALDHDAGGFCRVARCGQVTVGVVMVATLVVVEWDHACFPSATSQQMTHR